MIDAAQTGMIATFVAKTILFMSPWVLPLVRGSRSVKHLNQS
jgi:hypothetical protein